MKNKIIMRSFMYCLLSALILRTVQLLFFTMDNTGFLKNNTAVVGTIVTFVIFGLVALPFAFACMGRRQPTLPTYYPKVLCILAFLLAALILAEALFAKFPIFINAIMSTGFKVTGILAAGVLIAYGCLGIINGYNFRRGWLVLIVAHAFSRLIISFTCYSSLSGTVDSFIDIFMLCSQLLFLFMFAKVNCFVDTNKACFMILPYGITTISFTALNTVPKLLMLIIGKSSLAHAAPTFLLTNIAFALFAAYFTYFCFASKNLKSKCHTTKILPKDIVDVSDDSYLI